MKPEPIDLNAIEARAKAATPGDWEADGLEGQVRVTSTHVVVDGITMWAETDAQHIAGMDPSTTLRMVAEIRALRAALWDVAQVLDPPCGCPIDPGCALPEEAAEAVRVAREALGS